MIETGKQVKYTIEFIVVIGYILFCVLLFACLGFYFVNVLQQPALKNEFAESLPPTTPTPHILFTDQLETATILFKDDFDDDQNGWVNGQGESKEQVKNGKLTFESLIENNYSIAGCRSCTYMVWPYYFEADFSTDRATDQSYGIVFKLSYTNDYFYLFEINPEVKKYFLYYHIQGEWYLLASGHSILIQSYPASNILGLYVKKDTLELYINRAIVDSYTDAGNSFHSGLFGFYVNNSGPQIIIDNLRVYRIED